MLQWRIGCSGFHYNDWKRKFYPEDLPKRKWFEYYCRHFRTVELNVTFYRFPQLKPLQNWYDTSPQDFSFSVKVPRLITHYKRFNDSNRMLSDFYGTTSKGLKDKLGCILFQFPPTMYFNKEKLNQIISCLNPAFNNVLEFRHKSWWNDLVYKKLSDKNITFCGMSHPTLPKEVIQNHRVTYYRFHGTPNLYRSKYQKKTLERVANEIKNSNKTRACFIYFNNDIGGAAIENAKQIENLVKGY